MQFSLLRRSFFVDWAAVITMLVPALLLLLLFPPACAAAEPAQLRVLILTGESDYPYHDWRSTTPFLRGLLERTGRFDVKVVEEVRGLDAAALAAYDVLVLNYNGPRWGETTERAIEEFVRGGKGLVAVHAVSYGSFFGMEFRKGRWIYPEGITAGWRAYPDLVGASWKRENIGHAVRHAFSVKWIDRTHPISRDLPETFIISDELYHRIDLRPGARILASAYSDPKMGGTGKDEPMFWTVAFGKGRVVHTPLGHDTAAMVADGFQAAFARSCEWAATGTVSLPRERQVVSVSQTVPQESNAPGHNPHDLVTFDKFPSDPRYFRADLRAAIPGIIERHGMEEWRVSVLTSEVHQHLGIYSVVGAKMGLLAREYFGVGLDKLHILSHAGLKPPVSCLNDGLQVSTGATLGHGTILVGAEGTALPEAEFIYEGRRILLCLKPEILKRIREDIAHGVRQYGDLTPAYFDFVRELSVSYWMELDRKKIFEIKESGK
jgi:type 1 glutamine amidotransferase/formylmethanofuran dehydrogenase subunit E